GFDEGSASASNPAPTTTGSRGLDVLAAPGAETNGRDRRAKNSPAGALRLDTPASLPYTIARVAFRPCGRPSRRAAAGETSMPTASARPIRTQSDLLGVRIPDRKS